MGIAREHLFLTAIIRTDDELHVRGWLFPSLVIRPNIAVFFFKPTDQFFAEYPNKRAV
jgi:hypothetical protein